MRHVAGFAFGEVTPEDFGDVAADADLHQVPGKVAAGNQLWISRVLECTFECSGNACLCQSLRHLPGPSVAAAPRGIEPLQQLCIGVVETQADDVHRGIGKRHRNLDAREKGKPDGAGGLRGLGLAADLVMVGQRPELDAVAEGTPRQFVRRQGTVRDDRVAVEVGIEADRPGFLWI